MPNRRAVLGPVELRGPLVACYTPAHVTELPATFGKYFLTEKIAAGGMAQIYLAKLIGPGGFEKQLVIKQIHPELSDSSRFVAMFVAEAKTLVSLSHGNIVPVYELGVVEGTYFIAMEYIDGPTLGQLVGAYRETDTALPPTVAAYICAELLKGLDYAHRKSDGVVHRDLSPRNVLISRDGAVKLVDFGIAVTVDNQVHGGEGQPTGSFPYMSPEQVEHAPLTAQSDLFSAGVLLWEMLTGQRLFARGTADATLAAVLGADIPPPSSLRSQVPAVMDAICARALCRDLKGRVATAAEFLTALNRHLYSVETPVTPQLVSSLVATHCPPIVRRTDPSDVVSESDPAATPVGDVTAVVERTVPTSSRRRRAQGKGDRATTKSFATNVQFKGVLANATPLIAFDAIVDEIEGASGGAADPTEPTSTPLPEHAPRGALPPTTRRRYGLVALALLLVSLGAATLTVALRRAGEQPRAIAYDATAAVVNTRPDAAMSADARPPVLATPFDARPAPAQRADARVVRARPDARRRIRPRRFDAAPRRPRATGTLKVGANPWGDVFFDGKRLGRAPGSWKVPAGLHTIVVSFPVPGREKKRTFRVQIQEGATRFVGVVDFSPTL